VIQLQVKFLQRVSLLILAVFLMHAPSLRAQETSPEEETAPAIVEEVLPTAEELAEERVSNLGYEEEELRKRSGLTLEELTYFYEYYQKYLNYKEPIFSYNFKTDAAGATKALSGEQLAATLAWSYRKGLYDNSRQARNIFGRSLSRVNAYNRAIHGASSVFELNYALDEGAKAFGAHPSWNKTYSRSDFSDRISKVQASKPVETEFNQESSDDLLEGGVTIDETQVWSAQLENRRSKIEAGLKAWLESQKSNIEAQREVLGEASQSLEAWISEPPELNGDAFWGVKYENNALVPERLDETRAEVTEAVHKKIIEELQSSIAVIEARQLSITEQEAVIEDFAKQELVNLELKWRQLHQELERKHQQYRVEKEFSPFSDSLNEAYSAYQDTHRALSSESFDSSAAADRSAVETLRQFQQQGAEHKKKLVENENIIRTQYALMAKAYERLLATGVEDEKVGRLQDSVKEALGADVQKSAQRVDEANLSDGFEDYYAFKRAENILNDLIQRRDELFNSALSSLDEAYGKRVASDKAPKSSEVSANDVEKIKSLEAELTEWSEAVVAMKKQDDSIRYDEQIAEIKKTASELDLSSRAEAIQNREVALKELEGRIFASRESRAKHERLTEKRRLELESIHQGLEGRELAHTRIPKNPVDWSIPAPANQGGHVDFVGSKDEADSKKTPSAELLANLEDSERIITNNFGIHNRILDHDELLASYSDIPTFGAASADLKVWEQGLKELKQHAQDLSENVKGFESSSIDDSSSTLRDRYQIFSARTLLSDIYQRRKLLVAELFELRNQAMENKSFSLDSEKYEEIEKKQQEMLAEIEKLDSREQRLRDAYGALDSSELLGLDYAQYGNNATVEYFKEGAEEVSREHDFSSKQINSLQYLAGDFEVHRDTYRLSENIKSRTEELETFLDGYKERSAQLDAALEQRIQLREQKLQYEQRLHANDEELKSLDGESRRALRRDFLSRMDLSSLGPVFAHLGSSEMATDPAKTARLAKEFLEKEKVFLGSTANEEGEESPLESVLRLDRERERFLTMDEGMSSQRFEAKSSELAGIVSQLSSDLRSWDETQSLKALLGEYQELASSHVLKSLSGDRDAWLIKEITFFDENRLDGDKTKARPIDHIVNSDIRRLNEIAEKIGFEKIEEVEIPTSVNGVKLSANEQVKWLSTNKKATLKKLATLSAKARELFYGFDNSPYLENEAKKISQTLGQIQELAQSSEWVDHATELEQSRDLSTIRAEISKLRGERRQLESQIDETKAQLTSHESDLRKLVSDFDFISQKDGELKQKVASHEGLVQEFSGSFAEAIADDSVENAATELTKSLDEDVSATSLHTRITKDGLSEAVQFSDQSLKPIYASEHRLNPAVPSGRLSQVDKVHQNSTDRWQLSEQAEKQEPSRTFSSNEESLACNLHQVRNEVFGSFVFERFFKAKLFAAYADISDSALRLSKMLEQSGDMSGAARSEARAEWEALTTNLRELERVLSYLKSQSEATKITRAYKNHLNTVEDASFLKYSGLLAGVQKVLSFDGAVSKHLDSGTSFSGLSKLRCDGCSQDFSFFMSFLPNGLARGLYDISPTSKLEAQASLFLPGEYGQRFLSSNQYLSPEDREAQKSIISEITSIKDELRERDTAVQENSSSEVKLWIANHVIGDLERVRDSWNAKIEREQALEVGNDLVSSTLLAEGFDLSEIRYGSLVGLDQENTDITKLFSAENMSNLLRKQYVSDEDLAKSSKDLFELGHASDLAQYFDQLDSTSKAVLVRLALHDLLSKQGDDERANALRAIPVVSVAELQVFNLNSVIRDLTDSVERADESLKNHSSEQRLAQLSQRLVDQRAQTESNSHKLSRLEGEYQDLLQKQSLWRAFPDNKFEQFQDASPQILDQVMARHKGCLKASVYHFYCQARTLHAFMLKESSFEGSEFSLSPVSRRLASKLSKVEWPEAANGQSSEEHRKQTMSLLVSRINKWSEEDAMDSEVGRASLERYFDVDGQSCDEWAQRFEASYELDGDDESLDLAELAHKFHSSEAINELSRLSEENEKQMQASSLHSQLSEMYTRWRMSTKVPLWEADSTASRNVRAFLAQVAQNPDETNHKEVAHFLNRKPQWNPLATEEELAGAERFPNIITKDTTVYTELFNSCAQRCRLTSKSSTEIASCFAGCHASRMDLVDRTFTSNRGSDAAAKVNIKAAIEPYKQCSESFGIAELSSEEIDNPHEFLSKVKMANPYIEKVLVVPSVGRTSNYSTQVSRMKNYAFGTSIQHSLQSSDSFLLQKKNAVGEKIQLPSNASVIVPEESFFGDNPQENFTFGVGEGEELSECSISAEDLLNTTSCQRLCDSKVVVVRYTPEYEEWKQAFSEEEFLKLPVVQEHLQKQAAILNLERQRTEGMMMTADTSRFALPSMPAYESNLQRLAEEYNPSSIVVPRHRDVAEIRVALPVDESVDYEMIERPEPASIFRSSEPSAENYEPREQVRPTVREPAPAPVQPTSEPKKKGGIFKFFKRNKNR